MNAIKSSDKKSANQAPLRIEVLAAKPQQEAVVATLLQLYAHDFSEFYDLDLGEDGRFEYKELSLYWRAAGRYPFLIRVDGKLAGFVLVKRGSEISSNPDVWDMAEFFVVRGYRGRGVGTEIAHQVWRQLSGRWEVRVLQSNRPACKFWERAITGFAREPVHPAHFEKRGEGWLLFSFESKRV